MSRLPTFYLSHGGGPWPYMTGKFRETFAGLEASLRGLPASLPEKPKAVLVITGHWEEKDFAVSSSPAPGMVYDYTGFPEETYHIKYAAPGSPELAARAHSLIRKAGLPSHLDPERGYDHGTFSMLAVTHPKADTPVVQVSIREDYDPTAHIKLGRALAPLRDEGILIIGSGSSYHNFHPQNPQVESNRFDSWLKDTLVDAAPDDRLYRLLNWEDAPYGRTAHPREDHLVPLHAAVGAASEDAGQVIFREEHLFGDWTLSSYRFG